MSDGILFGFKLTGVDTTFKDLDMPNYKLATNSPVRATVQETIRDEIRQGNYVISATKPTVVSALGAIPKPNSTEVRLIHDCSRPHGHAVNDYITTGKFKFQTLDDATRALLPGYYMAKIDLRHAYRSVPIHRPTTRLPVANGVSRATISIHFSMILTYPLEQNAPRKSFTG